ncbi:hypothetical protein [Herbihabitans rhizosphaerae]|uniref:hypothetical protein n=1 Tax=Herbihabitans rhizosphaerae TaxID=1872711 RepID=UPI0013EEB45D|nr:hypothetical protein [Herbihabitans rhizosphaerae]
MADPLMPEWVSWFYGSENPVWPIRAVLGLPPPGDPEEARYLRVMSAPDACRIGELRPVTIRPGDVS